jgi:hypothetical protein
VNCDEQVLIIRLKGIGSRYFLILIPFSFEAKQKSLLFIWLGVWDKDATEYIAYYQLYSEQLAAKL